MSQETENLTTQGIQIKVASKVCGKCKRELPSKDFWGSRSSKDGLQGACKDCQLETPLGTHTTDLTKVVPVKTEPAHKKKHENRCTEKKARPSRAHPIGSGRRKECGGCKYRWIGGESYNCISEKAITNEKNQAKVCPYRETKN